MLAAFVLMKQNRMGMVADRRDHLDLQVNLLTEQRATQIIQMLDWLSTRLGVHQHQDEVSRELGKRVAVEHLVEELPSRLPDTSDRQTTSDRQAPSNDRVAGVCERSACGVGPGVRIPFAPAAS